MGIRSVAHLSKEFFALLEQYAGVGTSQEPDDNIWLGANGELDIEQLFDTDWGPLTSLEMILQAIIAAHSDPFERSDKERLEIAMAALLGKQRKSGMKGIDDDESLLRQIARWHYVDYCRHDGHRRSFAELVRDAYRQSGTNLDEMHQSVKDRHYRRLRRKFTKRMDMLLLQASASDIPEQIHRKRLGNRILADLGALGVKTAPVASI